MEHGTRHPLSQIRTYLKQIIYGGNDGIVTTFAIVAGFAGANADGVAQVGAVAVLVFGLANLFADAVSMGLGEFLSSRSAHDLYRARRSHQIGKIHTTPEDQIVILTQLFKTKGLPDAQSRRIAQDMSISPQLMSEMILCHQHGITPPEEENPAVNGAVTFFSFVLFGSLPLIPYFIGDADRQSLILSAMAMVLSLTSLGLLRWVATGDKLRMAVLETVGVGTLCALVAYVVGWLVSGMG